MAVVDGGSQGDSAARGGGEGSADLGVGGNLRVPEGYRSDADVVGNRRGFLRGVGNRRRVRLLGTNRWREVEEAIKRADLREESPAELRKGNSEFAYKEIKNVLWIENDPVYSAALREWGRKESYLGNRVDRREKSSADLRNQVFNIVGFFSVFQGVVLTVVATLKTSSGPHCGIIWFPILLSTVAAIVSILGVYLKFADLEDLEFSIHCAKQAQSEAAERADALRRKGENFKFYLDTKIRAQRKQKSFSKSRAGVIFSFLVFTAICIVSYFVILCDSLVIHQWNEGL